MSDFIATEPNNALEYLHEQFRLGRVVVVVGAGVSKAVGGVPTWRSAIESAIDHLHHAGTVPDDRVALLREQLERSTSPQDLIDCATQVRNLLEGSSESSGEFATWLQSVFASPSTPIADPDLLRALHAIPSSMVATTNYDKLLSSTREGSEPITWRSPNRLSLALQNGANWIVHLHGIWDDPESVVFGMADYALILNDSAYQAFLRTLWLDRTLLFIGCSFDGLRDPDFSRLLDWAEHAFPHSTNHHLALSRSNSLSLSQKELLLNKWRIRVIEYGDHHDDLVSFLAQFFSRSLTTAPKPPLTLSGRHDEIDSLVHSLLDGKSVLVYGMGGIGKTTLVSAALARIRGQVQHSNQIWVSLEGREVSLIDLFREVGHRLSIPGIWTTSDTEAQMRVTAALGQLSTPVVVFDDLPNPGEGLKFAIYTQHTGASIAVTSRQRHPGFDRLFAVASLNSDDSTELFGRVAGTPADQAPLVSQICSFLEGHPLAITLAAARYAIDGIPLASLTQRIATERHRLDTLRDPDQPELPSTSIRASLAISIDNLDDELYDTLAVLAYFYADTTISLLALALDLDSNTCEDRVGRLVRRCLAVRTEAGAIRLHQLIRDSIREASREAADIYMDRIQRSLSSVIYEESELSRESRRRLIANLNNATQFVLDTDLHHSPERIDLATRLVAVLCGSNGLLKRYSISMQHQVPAREMILSILQIAERIGHKELAGVLLQCLAVVYADAMDYPEALDTLARAQEIFEAAENAHASLASVKCEVGNLLMEIRLYGEAEAAVRSGLADAYRSGNAISIAQITGQLGRVLLLKGDLEQSEVYYSDAKKRYEEMDFLEGVAACLSNLAEIAERRGDYEQSWSFHRQSLEFERNADNFFGAWASLEQLVSKVRDREQLLFVCEQIDGLIASSPYASVVAHPGLGDSLKATAYSMIGDLDNARTLFLTSIEKRRAADDTRGVAMCLGNLSNNQLRWGKPDEAWRYNEQSKELYHQIGDLEGFYRCFHNGVSLALELGNAPLAQDQACTAIALAALMGDLDGAFASFRLLTDFVLSKLESYPDILFPGGELSYQDLMGLVAQTANVRDLGRLIGTMTVVMGHYGPGGVARSI